MEKNVFNRAFATLLHLVEQTAKKRTTHGKCPPPKLLANGCNLDRKNPRAKEDITHLPPAQLAADILKKEQRIAEIMGNIQKLLAKLPPVDRLAFLLFNEVRECSNTKPP